MKIPFDIKYRPQIESGEYTLETRDGNRARIICWDREDNAKQPLVALVKERDKESVIYTKINGEYLGTYGHGYDLFIVTPEEELTEFENELATVIGFAIAQSVSSPNEKMVEFVKNWSERLLSLAREQFIKDGYVIEKKAFHDAVENISDKHLAEMSVQYSIHCKVEDGTRHAVMNWDTFQKVAQKFINIGKAESLKDLPRWKYNISYNDNPFIYGWHKENGSVEYRLEYKGKTIMLEDLEKLPKEDEK